MRLLPVTMLTGVAIAGIASQEPPEPDDTVPVQYVGEDGSVVEVVAVCKLSVDAVECWDVQGEPATTITEAYARSMSGNDYGGRVTLQFGKKNRTLIVRSYRGNSNRYLQIETSRANSVGSGSSELRTLSDDAPSSYQNSYRTISLHFENDQTETFVDVTERLPIDSKIVLRLAPDETFAVNSVTFTLGRPVRNDGSTSPFGYPGNPQASWRIPVESRGTERRTYSYIPQAFDKDGQPITYVDLKGKPISLEEYDEIFRPNPANRMYGQPQSNATVSLYLPSEGRDGSITTSIDPKYISELRIGVTWVRRIRITGIPLDPKVG